MQRGGVALLLGAGDGLMIVGSGRVLGLVAARALALPRVLPCFERFFRGVRLYRSLCSVRCVPVLARVWV